MTAAPADLWEPVRARLEAGGAGVAVAELCDRLSAARDWPNLFYARLLGARVRLGVSPFPTGPSTDLPPEAHEPYEEAIQVAAREAGAAFLADGNIPRAWTYYRLLGEPGPIRDAIARYEPGDEEDIYPVVEVAWQEKLAPTKGFDLILDRHGVCSAITMVGGADLRDNAALRDHCVGRLVRALHAQLSDRLRGDLEGRGKAVPVGAGVPEMLALDPEMPGEDGSHVDTSHLSSVVQMAFELPPGPELDLARELCRYGERLSDALQGRNDPPFDGGYLDYGAYLDVIAGEKAEEGLAHFRAKVAAGADAGYRFPAEVMVNLLLKVGRPSEALDVAQTHLADEDERGLSCPGVAELSRRAGKFVGLADHARCRDDPVLFLASLIAAQERPNPPAPFPQGKGESEES